MTVLHAFPEEDQLSREAHLQFWHGTIRPDHIDDPDDEYPIVCWCGGRRYNLSRDVCVVWHVDQFTPLTLSDADWGDDEEG